MIYLFQRLLFLSTISQNPSTVCSQVLLVKKSRFPKCFQCPQRPPPPGPQANGEGVPPGSGPPPTLKESHFENWCLGVFSLVPKAASEFRRLNRKVMRFLAGKETGSWTRTLGRKRIKELFCLYSFTIGQGGIPLSQGQSVIIFFLSTFPSKPFGEKTL